MYAYQIQVWRRIIWFLLLGLWISLTFIACSWNVPNNSPVPNETVLVVRDPEKGTIPSGNCCNIYHEKYISQQRAKDTIEYYTNLGLHCRASSSPQISDFQANIRVCTGELSEQVNLFVTVMPQDLILQDMQHLESSGGDLTIWPLEPEASDPNGETVILATVEIESTW